MTNQEFLLQSEDEILESMGKKAKVLRIEKNITQKQFAKKAGINEVTYGKFERTGIISLLGFLKVLRHLGKLKDISKLLSIDDIESLGVKEFLKKQTKRSKSRVRNK